MQQFAEIAPSGLVDPEALQEAKLLIQQMSARDMQVIGKGKDPVKLHNRLMRAQMAVNEYAKALAQSNTGVHADLVPRTGRGPLPMDTFPVTGGACTSSNGTDVNRIPVAIVLAADVTWFVADGVREAAQDGCKQEAVVAGEGGNGSTACIPVDAVWIAAKAVNEGIHFCDDDLTGNVVDANYARLAFLHDQITGMDNHLTNVDNHLSGEVTALQAQMVALLAALSNQVGKCASLRRFGQSAPAEIDCCRKANHETGPAAKWPALRGSCDSQLHGLRLPEPAVAVQRPGRHMLLEQSRPAAIRSPLSCAAPVCSQRRRPVTFWPRSPALSGVEGSGYRNYLRKMRRYL